MHIRQAKIAALETERQFRVLQTEQMQNRRVDVVDVATVFHGAETEFVGLADDRARFHAAAREPHRERVNVMIAPGLFAHFAHRRATEFAAPDHERVFQKTALFQIFDERGARLIDFLRDFLE